MLFDTLEDYGVEADADSALLDPSTEHPAAATADDRATCGEVEAYNDKWG